MWTDVVRETEGQPNATQGNTSLHSKARGAEGQPEESRTDTAANGVHYTQTAANEILAGLVGRNGQGGRGTARQVDGSVKRP